MACDTTAAPAGAPPCPAPLPPGPDHRSARWTIGALTAAAFASVSIELTPTGLLPRIAADLDVSVSAAGALVATWAVTLAATSIPLVRATRRWPRERVVAVALLVCGAATLATAAAPVLAVAVAARVTGAAAHGVVWALLVPYVAALVPPERLGRAVSVVLAGPTAAAVLGVPAGTALGALLGWRWTLALLALLTVPPALLLLRRRTTAAQVATGAPVPAGSWREPGARAVLRTSVATAALLAGHFAAATYVTVLVTDAARLGTDAVPLVLLVFGLAGVGGLAVAGPLSDRRPAGALPATAVAFAGGLGALALLGTSPVVAYAVVALWGFLVGLLPPVFQTRVTRLAPPAVRDTAGAVAITALNVGIAAGAALGGLALAGAGVGGLVTGSTLAGLVGVAVLLVPGAGRRRRGA
jgi:predicted MFS family arabinose efflux permease